MAKQLMTMGVVIDLCDLALIASVAPSKGHTVEVTENTTLLR